MKKEAEQEAQQPKPELRQGELSLEGGRAEAPGRADTVTRDTAGMQSSDRGATPARQVDTVPPVEAEDYPWAHAAAAQEDVPPLRPDLDPPKPDWYAPYEALQQDWNELIERVRQTGEPLFYAKGYADMIPRIQALAENPDIPAKTRAPMLEALEIYRLDLSARKQVEDYLAAAERHMDTHASLQRVADSLGVRIVAVSDHLGWRQEADRLTEAAETILADGETYGPHLDNLETGRARVEGNCHGCATSSGRMANMPPKSRNRNRAANLRIHRRQSNNRRPRSRPGCQSTKPCGRTGTPSSKTPGKPVSHHSTPTATWT